jgi:hypothetical protein
MQNNTEQPIPNAFQEQDKVITDYEFAKGISDEELFADEWQDTEQEDAENSKKKNLGLFTVMPANGWMKQASQRPIPKMLFGEFWFEGEVCILFADTNLGKSILAVQIGNSISKGEQIYGFPLEAKKQPVLYFDFELSDKQFENRYSIQFQNHYQWDDNFLRVEINPDSLIPENVSSEDYLNYSLEQSIIQTGSKVLIVDNLTYLKNETEKAKDALPLMKHLKALKNKYGLSILALAHTPKRDLSKPITKNDLQGSKMLQNLCDSSFTIGESQKDSSLRYLKQIKVRFKEFRFDSDNVCVCQISKPFNLLQFEFLDFQTEREHLKEVSDQDKGQRMADTLELHKQGHSNTAIAQRFGISEGAVRKWLKKMAEPVK